MSHPDHPHLWLPAQPAATILTVAALLSLVVAFALPIREVADAAPGTVVALEPPNRAKAGTMISVALVAKQARDLAGFEATVQFDGATLRLVGSTVAEGPRLSGRDMLRLGPVLHESAADLGAATCPAAFCGDPGSKNARRVARGVNGRVELGRLEFYTESPGTYELRLDRVQLVDPNGNTLAAATANAIIVVDDRTTGQTLDPVAAAGDATVAPPAAERVDLTHNGIVDDADAQLVIDAWTALRQDDQCLADPLADRDITGNGCVDVADVQSTLSRWGTPVAGSSVPAAATTRKLASAASGPTDVMAAMQAGATFVVNASSNEPDASPGNGTCATAAGACTLRAAVQETTARPGPDTINFNIRNTDGSCPAIVTINATSAFVIDDKQGPTTINGYTQCGASPNTQAQGGNAVIKIEVRGNATNFVDGLYILSSGNTIRGLAVYNWDRQILISGAAVANTVIAGNFIGTNAANTFQTSSSADHHRQGIVLRGGASNNRIGGTSPADRNVVAGNGKDGIQTYDENVCGNVIIGNYIGIKKDGVAPLRNNSDGIDLNNGACNTRIGGTAAGERNIISGNSSEAIEISHGSVTTGNQVVGNYIGLDAFGNPGTFTGNRHNAISLEDGVANNLIASNVIAHNSANGVRFYILAMDNEVSNNLIGVRPDGVTPQPNGTDATTPKGRNGVFVMGGSQGNVIRNNVIANHPQHGILLSNTSDPGHNGFGETFFNTVSENSISNNTQNGIRLLCKTNPANGQNVCANQGLAKPTISSASSTSVSGTACASCRVEVFIADKAALGDPSGDNAGEGKTFIGAANANGAGSFTVNVSGVAAGQLVTATATNGQGNTSQFANNIVVAGGSTGTVVNLPGTFQVEDYRSGGEGVGYHDTTAGNNGGQYRTDNVDIQTCTDPTSSPCYNVGWTVAGEWLAYDVRFANTGNYTFTVRVATPNAGRQLHLELNGTNISGPIAIPNTGGYQSWANVSTGALSISAGTYTLRIVEDTGSFNMNYVTVTAATAGGVALPGAFQVEDYRGGGEGIGYHDTTAGNAGNSYRDDNVDIQTCGDPTSSPCYNVGWIAPGEWLAYDVSFATAGDYTFSIRVASPYSDKRLRLQLNGSNITGAITVPNTGGYQTWSNVVTDAVPIEAGSYTLKIVAETSSFNMNYVTVTPS